MWAFFAGKRLELPEKVPQKKISDLTPQLSFVRTHKSDIEKELGALTSCVKDCCAINTIYDVMAGSGFSGKIFETLFPKAQLVLNDLDPTCASYLKRNFPTAEVFQTYAEKVQYSKIPDILFIDFNAFTLLHFEKWRPTFQWVKALEPRFLLFTDSASYGFKFGNKNLASYGVSSTEAYYHKVGESLHHQTGYSLISCCNFGNASILRAEQKERPSYHINFLSFSPIPITLTNTDGLGLL